MGFPIFHPIYVPGTSSISAAPSATRTTASRRSSGSQLSYRYGPCARTSSPPTSRSPRADQGDDHRPGRRDLRHDEVPEPPHPLPRVPGRLPRGVFCTAYDTEPFQNPFLTDPDKPGYDAEMAREGEEAARLQNERLEAFFAGADVLVYDAQYTEEEYAAARRGWGHTSCEQAIAAARRGASASWCCFITTPSARTPSSTSWRRASPRRGARRSSLPGRAWR